MDSTAGAVGFTLVMMIAVFALSGLLVGALARWLLPGPDPMSWPATIGYGLAGSFLGGIVGRFINIPYPFSIGLSVGGAALLIWFFRRRKPAQ